MVGVPGVAARLFDRFHKAGVAVKLIAQVGRAHRVRWRRRNRDDRASPRRASCRWSSRAAARDDSEGEDGPVDPVDLDSASGGAAAEARVVRKERGNPTSRLRTSAQRSHHHAAHRNSTQNRRPRPSSRSRSPSPPPTPTARAPPLRSGRRTGVRGRGRAGGAWWRGRGRAAVVGRRRASWANGRGSMMHAARVGHCARVCAISSGSTPQPPRRRLGLPSRRRVAGRGHVWPVWRARTHKKPHRGARVVSRPLASSLVSRAHRTRWGASCARGSSRRSTSSRRARSSRRSASGWPRTRARRAASWARSAAPACACSRSRRFATHHLRDRSNETSRRSDEWRTRAHGVR